MTNEEKNWAELGALGEVERILGAEERKIRAEECPQGEECPVHFRVDEVFFDEALRYARLITYLGEYAVVTEDNPDLNSPALLVKAILGSFALDDAPARWATMVVHVGEGVLGDGNDSSLEERRQAFRYHAPHNDWNSIQNFHEVVVSALKQGMIDVSKPWEWDK